MVREIRRRARQIAPQVLAACVVGYFAFHAVQGERGLRAYLHLQDELAQLEATAEALAEERRDLEARVARLRPESLDPDMLEERARRVLNLTRDDEIIIFLEND